MTEVETFLEAAAQARGEQPAKPPARPTQQQLTDAIRKLRAEAKRRRQPEAERVQLLSAAEQKRERRRARNLSTPQ